MSNFRRLALGLAVPTEGQKAYTRTKHIHSSSFYVRFHIPVPALGYTISPDRLSRTRMRLCGCAHALVQKGLGTRLALASRNHGSARLAELATVSLMVLARAQYGSYIRCHLAHVRNSKSHGKSRPRLVAAATIRLARPLLARCCLLFSALVGLRILSVFLRVMCFLPLGSYRARTKLSRWQSTGRFGLQSCNCRLYVGLEAS